MRWDRALPAAAFAVMTAGTGAMAQEGSVPSVTQAAEPQRVTDAFLKNVTLLGVPSATAAPDGLVFFALSGTDRRDGVDDDEDGSAAVGLGVGLGETANLQFTANITSLEDDFADSGYLSAKVSQQVNTGEVPSFLSVTADRIAPWGDSDTLDPSATLAFTSFPVLNTANNAFPLMLTVGAGTDIRDFGTEPGAFGGIGIGVTRSFGASFAYDGDNFDLGTAFRIPGSEQFGLNVTFNDVFDEDDRQQVTFSLIWVLDNVF